MQLLGGELSVLYDVPNQSQRQVQTASNNVDRRRDFVQATNIVNNGLGLLRVHHRKPAALSSASLTSAANSSTLR